MKKTMKATALFLAAGLLLTACGGKTDTAATTAAAESAKADTETTAAATETDAKKPSFVFVCTGQLGDKSFNDSANAGMEKIASDLGCEVKVIEIGRDQTKWEPTFQDLAEEGKYDVIISNGSSSAEVIEQVAEEFPDQKFVMFDSDMEEGKWPNLYAISYKQNEGSYLVGVVAAAMSKSGVVGAVGGTESPTVCDFIVGYIDGAQSYNPDIKVVTAWIGDWTNSAKCLELCTMQYNTYGADVFFPIAAGAGTGAFEAAMNNGDGLWAIGVDSDQHEAFVSSGNEKMANVILTSMVKNIDKTIVSIFEDQKAGKEHWGELRVLGVKEGAVGYADNEFFAANVSEDVMKAVKAAEEKIINGELDVKSFFDFENGAADYNDYVATVAP